jgi:poly-gamma-glutamate capsule biosynthesis protein CapA/YwtB (metallophosphatase superfamily)
MFSLFFQRILRIACIGLLVLFLFGVLAAQTEGEKSIVLTFTGDCTLGSEDRLRSKADSFDAFVGNLGYGWPFARVKDFFAEDDVTVINLENVFHNSTDGKIKKTYNFRGPTAFARILTEGSIELAYLGNNHIMDYGTLGMRSTIQSLEEQGIGWCFNSWQKSGYFIFEKEGIKIGFAGAYLSYWGANSDKMATTFRQMRNEGCNAIVGIIHGGVEYSPKRVKRQENMAAWMVRNGASLVIGHHPHVVQGVEKIGNASVIYSLGNFSFGGNKDLRADKALIARVVLTFTSEGEYLGHQVNLIPVSPSGALTYNNYQPVFLSGERALKTMELVQNDTDFPLAPFLEGIGALQPFVPANE